MKQRLKNCPWCGRLLDETTNRARGRRRKVEATKPKSLLILVKGDPVSRNVERDARRAGFSGRIVKFSEAQAREQHTPLPLLIKEGELPVGPDGLVEYFKTSA